MSSGGDTSTSSSGQREQQFVTPRTTRDGDAFVTPRSNRDFTTPRANGKNAFVTPRDNDFGGDTEGRSGGLAPVKEAPSVEQKVISELFSYARHGKKKEIEDLLKEKGINVDVKDDHGNTIFLIACQNGHKKICKLSLRQGGKINHQNKKGCSGLHYCFAYNYKDLGDYLISKGANEKLLNKDNQDCYIFAKSQNRM